MNSGESVNKVRGDVDVVADRATATADPAATSVVGRCGATDVARAVTCALRSSSYSTSNRETVIN